MDKKFFLPFLLFIGVALYLLLRSFSIENTVEAEKKNAPLPVSALKVWKSFHNEEHGFRVQFPTNVDEQSFGILDPRMHQKQFYEIFSSQELNSTVYVVNIISFPPGFSPEKSIGLVQNKINDIVATGRKSRLVESKTTQLFGENTTEFEIEGENYTIFGAAFIHEGKLYLLSVTSLKENTSQADWEFFVRSFKLDINKERK
jgi:hypothetical protein